MSLTFILVHMQRVTPCTVSSPSARGVLFELPDANNNNSYLRMQVETADCGKPIVEARADIQMCVDVLRYYAELAPTHLAEQPLESVDADYAGSIVKEARGVVLYRLIAVQITTN